MPLTNPSPPPDPCPTSIGTPPVESALDIFCPLDRDSPPVLAAGFGLFLTGNPAYFHALMNVPCP